MTLKVLTNNNTADYVNADGLIQRYGTQEQGPSKSGEYMNYGSSRVVEFNIPDVTLLGAGSSLGSIVDDVTTIPNGAFIRKIEIIVRTACTGSNATLSVGTVKRDMSTVASSTGLIAALAVTSLATLGDNISIVASTTGAGALVKGVTTGTDAGGYYVQAFADASNPFSAGALTIRVLYDFNGT